MLSHKVEDAARSAANNFGVFCYPTRLNVLSEKMPREARRNFGDILLSHKVESAIGEDAARRNFRDILLSHKIESAIGEEIMLERVEALSYLYRSCVLSY